MSGNIRCLRQSERFDLVAPALCISRTGFRDRVIVSNISCGGCQIESRALTLQEGDLVLVRIEGMEGIAGEIRWVIGHKAGISFSQELYGPVVEHIHRKFEKFLGDETKPELRMVA